MSVRRAVIWDLDGTIIDSAPHHWEAWKLLTAAENFSLSYEEYVSDFGRRNDEILRLRMDPHLSDSEVARISLAKEEAYRQLVRTQGIDLLPGVEYWLSRLGPQGWLQALGTSAPRGNVDAIFDALPVRHYFDAVMSADQVAHGKPHPDVFLAAAAAMSTSAW